MAMLVNRNSSRIECLYYILQAAYVKYGIDIEFNMKDLKFNDEDENNTHKFCNLLQSGFSKYCPYLDNQFDTSKCYATRSLEFDSTKGKQISDVVRTLEGLGFITSTQQQKFIITNEGENWVKSTFGTISWQEIIDTAILSYGPFVGFLYKLKMTPGEIVTPTNIYCGYPNTEESINVKTDKGIINVPLSVGSQKDSITRTRSKLVSLGYTSGLWAPINAAENMKGELPHIQHRELLNKKKLLIGKLRKKDKLNVVTGKKLFVKNPLSYENLIKDIKSLRENGIELIRKTTMKESKKVINRRFIIVDVLNRASKLNTSISYNKLFESFKERNEEFFIETDPTKWNQILQSELDIAFLAGIPFDTVRKSADVEIIPLAVINEEVLRVGTPDTVLLLADKIWEKVSS